MSSGGGVSLLMGAGLLAGVGLSLSLADGHVTAPRIWKEKRARRVTWIGAEVPREEESEAAQEAMLRRGLSTYGDITRHMAEQLFWRDYQQSGWLADIGLLYHWYLLHACEALERLDGTLVRIDA